MSFGYPRGRSSLLLARNFQRGSGTPARCNRRLQAVSCIIAGCEFQGGDRTQTDANGKGGNARRPASSSCCGFPMTGKKQTMSHRRNRSRVLTYMTWSLRSVNGHSFDLVWERCGLLWRKRRKVVDFTDHNRPIEGGDFLYITSGIRQTVAGDFHAFDPGAASHWLFIRAWEAADSILRQMTRKARST